MSDLDLLIKSLTEKINAASAAGAPQEDILKLVKQRNQHLLAAGGSYAFRDETQTAWRGIQAGTLKATGVVLPAIGYTTHSLADEIKSKFSMPSMPTMPKTDGLVDLNIDTNPIMYGALILGAVMLLKK